MVVRRKEAGPAGGSDQGGSERMSLPRETSARKDRSGIPTLSPWRRSDEMATQRRRVVVGLSTGRGLGVSTAASDPGSDTLDEDAPLIRRLDSTQPRSGTCVRDATVRGRLPRRSRVDRVVLSVRNRPATPGVWPPFGPARLRRAMNPRRFRSPALLDAPRLLRILLERELSGGRSLCGR